MFLEENYLDQSGDCHISTTRNQGLGVIPNCPGGGEAQHEGDPVFRPLRAVARKMKEIGIPGESVASIIPADFGMDLIMCCVDLDFCTA